MSIGELEVGRWLWSTSGVDAKIKDQQCGAESTKSKGNPQTYICQLFSLGPLGLTRIGPSFTRPGPTIRERESGKTVRPMVITYPGSEISPRQWRGECLDTLGSNVCIHERSYLPMRRQCVLATAIIHGCSRCRIAPKHKGST
jgi:hypothetical protein